jgi:FeS assembly SUF system protein
MAIFKRKSKKTDERELLKATVTEALKTIYDPEIPVNIYDLGLIYDVIVNEHHEIDIKMTLTTPMCPVAQTFPMTVESKVREVEGVEDVTVELVWEPPWTPEQMSEGARVELGWF